MENKNTILIVVAVLLIFLLAWSWFFFGTTLTGEVVKQDESIKIGVIVYPGFAPFFIAQEKAFFEKEGVNAEVVLINDPTQAISALASGNVQVLFSSADFTPIVSDAGVDVREIFASDIGYGSDGLLVKNNLKSVEDLKGKTVYLSLGTPSHFLLRFMTEQAGLNKNDINIANMEADQVGATFVAGKIDYGMSWEPWLSKASERTDGKLLFSSKDKPGIITDTFIVRTDILNSRNGDIKAVVRAWFDSINFIKTNPDEANSIMSKAMGLSKEDFEAQASAIKFLSYEENLAKFNRNTNLNIYELTQKAVEIYREDGIIKSEIVPDKIIDAKTLKEIYS